MMPGVLPTATSTRLPPITPAASATATPPLTPATALMTAADIITDPDLRAVLDAATLAQQQCDALLTLLAHHPLPPKTPTTTTNPADSLPPGVADAISASQKTLHAHLAAVRNQNRRALLSVRGTKTATAEARHEVDTLHLALQNLYYKQRHLESEIKACQGYEHPYQRLPLMPETEFREAFPEVVERCSREDVGKERDGDEGMEEEEEEGGVGEEEFEDALMKARIEHEHKERLALEEKRQGLLKRKQGLIAENNKRKEDLAKLDESLEKFIEVSELLDGIGCIIGANMIIQAAKPIEQTFQKEY